MASSSSPFTAPLFSFSSNPSKLTAPEQPAALASSTRSAELAQTSGPIIGASPIIQVDNITRGSGSQESSSSSSLSRICDTQERIIRGRDSADRRKKNRNSRTRRAGGRRQRSMVASPTIVPTTSDDRSHRASLVTVSSRVDSSSISISSRDSSSNEHDRTRSHRHHHRTRRYNKDRRQEENRTKPVTQQRLTASPPPPPPLQTTSSTIPPPPPSPYMVDIQPECQSADVEIIGLSSNSPINYPSPASGANTVAVTPNSVVAAVSGNIPALEVATPASWSQAPVAPSTTLVSSDRTASLITTMLNTFQTILQDNQRVMTTALSQIGTHQFHPRNTPQAPQTPLSADPYSPQSLASVVESNAQPGVTSGDAMQVGRLGSDKVKIAWYPVLV